MKEEHNKIVKSFTNKFADYELGILGAYLEADFELVREAFIGENEVASWVKETEILRVGLCWDGMGAMPQYISGWKYKTWSSNRNNL